MARSTEKIKELLVSLNGRSTMMRARERAALVLFFSYTRKAKTFCLLSTQVKSFWYKFIFTHYHIIGSFDCTNAMKQTEAPAALILPTLPDCQPSLISQIAKICCPIKNTNYSSLLNEALNVFIIKVHHHETVIIASF
jgi:hypothetical protein